LGKAKHLREDTQQLDPFMAPSAEGISADDRREIIKEIEQVSKDNAMNVSADAFKFKAKKRGLALPFTIVLLSTVIALGGSIALNLVFQNASDQVLNVSVVGSEVTGLLLEEAQRQSQEALERKNREILQIQEELGKIEQDRLALETNFDELLSAKEEELQSDLEQRIRLERARLEEEGFINEDELNARIAQYTEAQRQELEQELTSFRASQEETQRELESQAVALRNSITQSEAEIASLQNDLEERTQELENQLAEERAAGQQAVSAVQEELNQLARQQELEKSLSSQITGLYRIVQESLNAEDFESAQENLVLLEDFLNSQELISIDSLRARREVDLFILSALEDLIAVERDRGQSQTVFQKAAFISRIENYAAKAEEFLLNGQPSAAETEYRKIITEIEEVQDAFDYFEAQSRLAVEQNQSQFNTIVNSALSLAQNGQSFQAIARFSQALEVLPAGYTVQGFVSTLSNTAGEGSLSERIRTQTENAQRLLNQAENLLENERRGEAIDLYRQIAETYPLSENREEILNALDNEITALEQALTASLETYASFETRSKQREENLLASIEILESEKTSLETDISSLNRRIDDLEEEITSLNEDMALGTNSSDEQNQAARARISELEAQVGNLEDEISLSEESIATLQTNFERLNEQFQNLSEQRRRVISTVQKFVEEDQALATSDIITRRGLVNSLYKFLDESVYPGIQEQLRQYELALIESIRDEAVEVRAQQEAENLFDELLVLADEIQGKSYEEIVTEVEALLEAAETPEEVTVYDAVLIFLDEVYLGLQN
jgi:chromosome segregation ATPase